MKNLQLHLVPKIKKKWVINSIGSAMYVVVELKCQSWIILPSFTLMYTYVYICMYICIYIYIYTYTHTHTHTHTYIYMCVCVFVCVLLSSHVFSVLILLSFYSLSTHYL